MAGRVQHEENTGNNVPSRTKPEVRAEKMGAKTPRDFDRWRGVGRVPSAVEFIGEGGLLDHLGEQATEDAIVRFWPGKRGEVIDLLGRLTKTKQLIYDGNTYRRA